jgi:hypothetical protein
VREDGGDGEAAGALDVHEEGAGSRHKLLLSFPTSAIDSRTRTLVDMYFDIIP